MRGDEGRAMRAREMHPLCCLATNYCPDGDGGFGAANGDCSPPPRTVGEAVAGLLSKWTNIGRGWLSRWFVIRSGVLAYSKTRRHGDMGTPLPIEAGGGSGSGVRLIGGELRCL